MTAPPLREGIDEGQLAKLIAFEEELGLRFELTDGGITWEASPGIAHQEIVYSVQKSLESLRKSDGDCECYQGSDIEIAFPDGSVKRPDVSVWCRRPDELEGFVHQVPEAVIEIVSPGYEAKDLVHGPPIYMRNGVHDVIVFDRKKAEVHHWTAKDHQILASPSTIRLSCGCQVVV